MEKLSTNLMLYFLAFAIAIATATARGVDDQSPEAVEAWFKNLPKAKQKLTKLHFYYHDSVTGKNPTAYTVAEANITATSYTNFGMLRMLDDPLTVGPEPDSKIIGHAQGIYGGASLEEYSLLMAQNFVFTEGEYNGSTLSVLGRNAILEKYREMPIVGGSGVFRLARGMATAQTVWFNMSAQSAVVEFHVVVLSYV